MEETKGWPAGGARPRSSPAAPEAGRATVHRCSGCRPARPRSTRDAARGGPTRAEKVSRSRRLPEFPEPPGHAAGGAGAMADEGLLGLAVHAERAATGRLDGRFEDRVVAESAAPAGNGSDPTRSEERRG